MAPTWPFDILGSLLALVIAFTLCLIISSIYRLTFHPLARYPGPLLSKISGFAVYLQAITSDRHLVNLREHEKYGPIVRIAPNQLSFSDPLALRQIYQSSRQNNPLRKSSWYETIDAPSGAYSTHSEVSRTKHAFRRRVLEHAFSDSSLRSAETFIEDNVNIFCKVLTKGTVGTWSGPRNMSDLCTWLAYDIMGDLVFGKRFDCLTSDDHRYVPKLLMSSSMFIYRVAHLPFQWLIRPLISSPTLMKLFGGQLAREEHQYVSYANERVAERLATQSFEKPRKDMIHYLVNARDPITSQPFTRQDLDAEASLFIAAGADTTSVTLAAAFFYLTLPSCNAILTHLQAHLRSTYPTPTSIKAPAVTQDIYLRAVIDETLRLAPPVPTHLPRTIIPNSKRGISINNTFIPAGTTVGSSAYVLHHNELAYPDSFAFKPERWISIDTTSIASNTATQAAVKTHLPSPSPLQHPSQVLLARQAFSPFSHGSRNCIGKNLAYLELSLTLACVLWMYDIRRSDTSRSQARHSTPLQDARGKRGWRIREDEYQLYDRFLAAREGPWIEFRLWEGAISEVRYADGYDEDESET